MKLLKNRLLAGIYVIMIILAGACMPDSSFNRSLSRTTGPYSFSIPAWEVGSAEEALVAIFQGKVDISSQGAALVREYFALNEQANGIRYEMDGITIAGKTGDIAALQAQLDAIAARKKPIKRGVERLLALQVHQVLAAEGIYNALLPLRVTFPMVSFRLGRPPSVLIISPRGHISMERAVLLRQGLELTYVEEIERQVDVLGVSSLVVEPGGFGAVYPTVVDEYASLDLAITLAVHEWLHQYLLFKPLGFVFLLHAIGVRPDYQVATMNETLNDIIASEIGAAVMGRYYPAASASRDRSVAFTHQELDIFEDEIGNIRAVVEDMLSRGQVEQAERYMEERRLYLVSEGYYIRKINQAYFAFEGSYADTPASKTMIQLASSSSKIWTSQEIGQELVSLRSRSESLRDFLERVAAMTGPDDLDGLP